MKVQSKFSNGQEITSYQATAYAEGFEEASFEDQLRAWAYLIATGTAWRLQGWFGRQAEALINNLMISRDGIIDYDRIEELSE